MWPPAECPRLWFILNAWLFAHYKFSYYYYYSSHQSQAHKLPFSACWTSFVEQASSYSLCSLLVWCIITIQLFSIIVLWYWTSCWHVSQRFPLLSYNPPFLSFSLHSHLSLIRLISWNLTTRCLAVTGSDDVGEYSRLNQPNWLLDALRYSYTLLTYFIAYMYIWSFCGCLVRLAGSQPL